MSCKCIYKCKETLRHENRVAVFDKYWKLGNLQAQRNFLAGLITKVDKKRMVVNAKVNRKFNIHYFLPKIDSSRVQVCKSTFLATLDESGRKIRTIIRKQHSGLCSPDKRASNAYRIPADILQKIHTHIQSFPCVPSHYTRANSKRQYLEPHLSVKKMYVDFTESLPEDVKPCSLQTYRNIFNTEYNLGFHHPKKDRCDFCAKYEEYPVGTEKDNMTPEYDAHIIAKNQARLKMLEDSNKSKNDRMFKCFTFDLQQVLLAPYFNVKSFYYKRKLCVYNLTIYDHGAGKGYCYVWDETIAQRGSCDIASCIVQHINTQCSEAEHISLYSDGCGGQNKNRFVFTALLHTMRKFSNLKSIEITFLVSGHTQMVCDSVHGTIEMAKKGQKIYVPQDWLQVIEKAKVHGIRYDAVPMNQKSFIDFKAVNEKLFDMKLNSKTVDGNKVKWSKIVSCRFEKGSENQLKIKYGYDDEEYAIVKLGKTATDVEIAQELPQLYSSILPISLAKKKDLITISNAVTFPDTARQYYQNLEVNRGKSRGSDESFPVRHDQSAHDADADEDQEMNLESPPGLEDTYSKSGEKKEQPSKKRNSKREKVKRIIKL
ncbi:unnamed protein product [Phaedon cochleariae]|uniref:DUF7869 domain-containing protein n=1 Tax=Phaedon cochleariae TaxID=80249 RepID=A0A9N9SHC3_PHACE|nr:unnamed protein product [Phaedon cochleariae]